MLTAGTMTIPVMKKSGFRASYAAAIEACASTGAVLAPPVMGATAFVIAQFLNISYADVALAAIIPAVLYYVGLFMQVDSYAARHGLKGIPRAELPKIWDTIKEGWYYIFVIALLIVMLLYFKRESHAPFYATALLVVLNQIGTGAVEARQHRLLSRRQRYCSRAQRVSVGHVPACRAQRILSGQELGRPRWLISSRSTAAPSSSWSASWPAAAS